jgi:hypothetical protein
MKKILFLFFVISIIFGYGCSKEEAPLTGKIIVTTQKSEEIEGASVGEEEREDIATVKLCHDTDHGILKFENGSIFGFYSNATRYEFNDYCMSQNYLMEFYCENETALQKSFLCRNGCTEGHCK